jgi:hypothetical protein
MTTIMAEPFKRSGATFDDIQQARAIRKQLEGEMAEMTKRTKRELNPMWARLTAQAVHDSFGEEITEAMRPRGYGRDE